MAPTPFERKPHKEVAKNWARPDKKPSRTLQMDALSTTPTDLGRPAANALIGRGCSSQSQRANQEGESAIGGRHFGLVHGGSVADADGQTLHAQDSKRRIAAI
jgi:hypothetical protein